MASVVRKSTWNRSHTKSYHPQRVQAVLSKLLQSSSQAPLVGFVLLW